MAAPNGSGSGDDMSGTSPDYPRARGLNRTSSRAART
jgi:hypothetical protein